MSTGERADREVVRPARRRDLDRTARLHARCLPDGFFVDLGAGFLRSYHATFHRGPAAVAIVAGSDQDPGGDPVAFLVGTLGNRRHYRWVVQRRALHLTLRLLLALLGRPAIAARFVRTRLTRYLRWLGRYPLRRARPGPDGPAATDDEETAVPAPVAVLTHVAVDPAARGRGLGRRLVDAFVERAREAGAAEVRLVTDDAGGAVDFYRALGFEDAGTHRDGDGAVVREFRLPLDAAA
jgi:ribosomal protein S18 acetylase RimI-like enzyme